jgi:hypothetical protein
MPKAAEQAMGFLLGGGMLGGDVYPGLSSGALATPTPDEGDRSPEPWLKGDGVEAGTVLRRIDTGQPDDLVKS